MNNYDSTIIRNKISRYYTLKVQQYGPIHLGVDWKTSSSQLLRFQQLVKIFPSSNKLFKVNDIGCGYGALYRFLTGQNYNFFYCGYDISPSMLKEAKKIFGKYSNCSFKFGNKFVTADYTIASGLFNVKLDMTLIKWKKYVLNLLDKMNKSNNLGMAFNMLTSYSDKDKMRPDLYYADPLYYFDLCKRNFSPHVALLHDYGLYEFTILIRKDLND